MGVRGRRIVPDLDEPTLLGNIDDIIEKAQQDGLISKYNVDIESIIKQHDIIIQRDDMSASISGYLTKKNGRWIIAVNKNHHKHRQRYTMAHEFAHFCLHKSENDDYFEDEIFFRDENQTSIEYAANLFAAKLLMPEALINSSIKAGATSLKKLAEQFDVSILAVKNRVISLGYKITNNEE